MSADSSASGQTLETVVLLRNQRITQLCNGVILMSMAHLIKWICLVYRAPCFALVVWDYAHAATVKVDRFTSLVMSISKGDFP